MQNEKCFNCGCDIQKDFAYCPECGVKLKQEEQKHSCLVYLSVVPQKGGDTEKSLDRAERELKKFDVEVVRKKNGLNVCANEEYDVYVSNMVRKCIHNFVGREEQLKDILICCGLEMYLEIVPQIVANSVEPEPCLSLDGDIIEFLYKTGVKHDLDYYVV
jgi:hypothetical protein